MKKIHLLLAAAALGLLAPTAVFAGKDEPAQKGPFIHIEVRENGGEEGAVNVNLPLALAQVALESMKDTVDKHTHIEFEHGDLTVSDLRKMWTAMRDAGDTEFVTVEDGGEKVRIYREGKLVYVNVDDGESKEKVRIQLPVAVMDALLSGDGEQLDLPAAVAEIGKMDAGEIVRVEGDGDLVRIWID